MSYLKTKIKCLVGQHNYIRKARTVQRGDKYHKQVYKQCMHCLHERKR